MERLKVLQEVTRSRKLYKNRQYNSQKKMDDETNNGRQTTSQKLKIWQ
jgi:hypothetical protein